jgi:hypothetical protein
MGYYEPAWDEEGNPEVGSWVKEEPDCVTCCDSGQVMLDDNDVVITGFGSEDPQGTVRPDGCPACNPSPAVAGRQQVRLAAWQADFEAKVAAGLIVLTDEPPF